MRIFLRLQYDGSQYHGWQVQPNGITVQETIEKSLSMLYRTNIEVIGCGRTDTGVHASDYYLHYDINDEIAIPYKTLIYRLNNILPADIKIIKAYKPVSQSINARFDAISRTYRYIISTEKDPFSRNYAYRYYYPLDIDKMNYAGEIMKEYIDFTSFSKTGTQVATNNCRVQDAHWEADNHFLYFYITADRFLRNMVRAVTGTMLQVGRGKLTLEGFRDVIEKKDRCSAGDSVPAHGLSLIHVEYGDKLIAVEP